MAIHIAVHDNEEGDRAVNLLTNRSRAQFRRWSRYHNIQAQREKALNKHAKGKETMFHEGKHTATEVRSHVILGVVGEAFGFGGAPVGSLTAVDSIGRALGRIGFHARIIPQSAGTWAKLHAEATTRPKLYAGQPTSDSPTFIDMNIYPFSGAIHFVNWEGPPRSDILRRGFVAIVQASPQNYIFIPDYDLLDGGPNIHGNDAVQGVISTTRPQKWIRREQAHIEIHRIEQREHQGAPGSIISLKDPAQFSPNYGLFPGRPPQGQAPSFSPGVRIQYTPPQRGFERSASQPYTGVAPETEFDYELSSMQRGGLPQRGDPREELRPAGTPPGYVQNYTTSVGHENEPVSSVGGRSAPNFGSFFSRPAATAASAIVAPAFSGASSARPSPFTPSSSQQPQQLRQRPSADDKDYRRMTVPWGTSHPAVVRVANVLRGMGPVRVNDRKNYGIVVSSADGTTSLTLDLRRAGGFARTGTLRFDTVNIHKLYDFLPLIPDLFLRGPEGTDRARRSLPIIWKNDFRPLVQHVLLHAPDQIAQLAAVLERLPKANRVIGTINRQMRTQGLPPLR